MQIRDWPPAERPREKLLQLGSGALSEAELLAIWLRHGTSGMNALDLARSLEAVSPLATVARGYAILQREDGRVVRGVDDAAIGEALDARLADGRLRVRVW